MLGTFTSQQMCFQSRARAGLRGESRMPKRTKCLRLYKKVCRGCYRRSRCYRVVPFSLLATLWLGLSLLLLSLNENVNTEFTEQQGTNGSALTRLGGMDGSHRDTPNSSCPAGNVCGVNDLVTSQMSKTCATSNSTVEPSELCVYLKGDAPFGNLLYQYASIMGIARKNGFRQVLLDHSFSELQKVFPKLPLCVTNRENGTEWFNVQETRRAFEPKFMSLPERNTVVSGFLQSFKYFEAVSNDLMKMLDDTNMNVQYLQSAEKFIHEKRNEFKKKIRTSCSNSSAVIPDPTLVCVHLSGGDLTRRRQRPPHVPSQEDLKVAVDYMRTLYSHVLYIVALEDTAWYKKYLQKGREDVVLTQQSPLMDFVTMTRCDHIIMTVGTFGWWAAWIMQHRNNGTVLYYQDMQLSPGMHNHADYYPPSWLRYDSRGIYSLNETGFSLTKPAREIAVNESGRIREPCQQEVELPKLQETASSAPEDVRLCKHCLLHKSIGQIGNLLFQYASSLGIFRKNGFQKLLFDAPFTQLQKLFPRLPIQIVNNKNQPGWQKVHETGAAMFDSKFMSLPNKSISIVGFLQSFKYFEGVSQELGNILNETNLSSEMLQNATEFIEGKLKDKKKNQTSSNGGTVVVRPTLVCMHVRRGDFINVISKRQGRNAPSSEDIHVAMDYMETLHSNIVYLVACQDKPWFEMHVRKGREDMVLTEQKSPFFDFVILTRCDHIIMTVGTFGWWAAWIMQHRNNGTVLYFKNETVSGSSLSKQMNPVDYYPQSWLAYDSKGIYSLNQTGFSLLKHVGKAV